MWSRAAPLKSSILAGKRNAKTGTMPRCLSMFVRYQNYSQGEWQVARNLLTKTHGMLSEKARPLIGALLWSSGGSPYEFNEMTFCLEVCLSKCG